MQVRLLTANDVPSYRELMLEAYDAAADAFTSTAEERALEPERWWLRRIADPAGLGAAFGAFDGDRLVGTVAVEYASKPKTRHKGLVVGMYVRAEAQGRGAGRHLLRAVIDHARARNGVKLLTLTVTQGNDRAVGLYASEGFEPFGVEPMAILTPGGYRAKVHMWRAIERAAEPR